jgi:hypothetical protein
MPQNSPASDTPERRAEALLLNLFITFFPFTNSFYAFIIDEDVTTPTSIEHIAQITQFMAFYIIISNK